MDIHLENQSRKKAVDGFIAACLILMTVFFHQTSRIMSTNYSLADVLVVVCLLCLAGKSRLFVKPAPFMFFLLVCMTGILTSFFLVPAGMGVRPDEKTIALGYVKLLIIFLYFMLGYCVHHPGMVDRLLRVYSITGGAVAVIAVFYYALRIPWLTSLFYYNGERWKGFMVDPNYFAIMQVSATVYFTRRKLTKYTLPVVSALIFSIFMSASKTGLLTLLIYFSIRFFEYAATRRKMKTPLLLVLLLVLFQMLDVHFITLTTEKIQTLIPIFSRVSVMFSDFRSAITEGGSSRIDMIGSGLAIVKSSPLLGVGIGNYMNVAEYLFGTRTVAHNTYVQLAVEWGTVNTLIFLLYMGGRILRSYGARARKNAAVVMIRDIVLVFLIGSMALSLNNARMFWFFLGMMIACQDAESADSGEFILP